MPKKCVTTDSRNAVVQAATAHVGKRYDYGPASVDSCQSRPTPPDVENGHPNFGNPSAVPTHLAKSGDPVWYKGKLEVVPPDDDHPDFEELPPAPPRKRS